MGVRIFLGNSIGAPQVGFARCDRNLRLHVELGRRDKEVGFAEVGQRRYQPQVIFPEMPLEDIDDSAPGHPLPVIHLQAMLPTRLFLQRRYELQAKRFQFSRLDGKHSFLNVERLLMLANRQVNLGHRLQHNQLV